MNVTEYLKRDNIKFEISAKEAYDVYKEEFTTSTTTFEYFRTKFNNHKKSLNLPVHNSNFETNSKKDIKEVIDPNLSLGVLKIHSYEPGAKIDLPDPIPTGTFADKIISKRLGFMRKCVDVTVGEPGAGKTFSRCALAISAKRQNPDIKIGFISCEMRESEWLEEIGSDPYLAEIKVIYMLDYVGKSNYLQILEDAIKQFDIVVVDSFAVIIHQLMLVSPRGTSEKKLIFDLIGFFIKLAEEGNLNIQLINQVNKDGNYKGGTELPHMTSSLCFVRVENHRRYQVYVKNRNNGSTIQQRLYFTKDKDKKVPIIFDQETYAATYEVTEDKKKDIKEFLNDFNLKNRSKDQDFENTNLPKFEADGTLELTGQNPEEESLGN